MNGEWRMVDDIGDQVRYRARQENCLESESAANICDHFSQMPFDLKRGARKENIINHASSRKPSVGCGFAIVGEEHERIFSSSKSGREVRSNLSWA